MKLIPFLLSLALAPTTLEAEPKKRGDLLLEWRLSPDSKFRFKWESHRETRYRVIPDKGEQPHTRYPKSRLTSEERKIEGLLEWQGSGGTRSGHFRLVAKSVTWVIKEKNYTVVLHWRPRKPVRARVKIRNSQDRDRAEAEAKRIAIRMEESVRSGQFSISLPGSYSRRGRGRSSAFLTGLFFHAAGPKGKIRKGQRWLGKLGSASGILGADRSGAGKLLYEVHTAGGGVIGVQGEVSKDYSRTSRFGSDIGKFKLERSFTFSGKGHLVSSRQRSELLSESRPKGRRERRRLKTTEKQSLKLRKK